MHFFFLYPLNSIQGFGSHGDTQRQTTMHPHSYGQATSQPNMHVYGLLEEAGVPIENPHSHGKNFQTPHRKAPAGI